MSPGKDLVLLKINHAGRKLPTIRVAEVAPAKGEKVYAFGEPMGLSGSVSDGLVAAVRDGREIRDFFNELTGEDIYVRVLGYDLDADWIQTTAPILAWQQRWTVGQRPWRGDWGQYNGPANRAES